MVKNLINIVRMYKHFFKRFFDFFGALIFILIFWPLYVIIAIMVKLSIGSPVLFKQERIGKGGKTFTMFKFRSMTNATDENGNLLHESLRHTKFGEALRSTSLDELPEIWSILRGDMSFVGPRPLPTYYNPYYYKSERKRHEVVGGLIPSDSLSLELNQTYELQFKWDCYYADHLSLWLDIKTILYTFKIEYLRMTKNYGSVDRPHLNVMRANISKQELDNN